MAAVEVSALDKKQHDELCCIYASLLLHDDKQDISGENIKKIIQATGNDVDSYWPGSFARALKGRNVGDLLANVGSAAPAAAPTAGAPQAEQKQEAAEEPKKEDEPEDVEMGNLFGDDDEEDY